jgi:hypothetical protein
MSHRQPVRVPDRHAFDTLIDARSPAEFALDHIPGAINCPVLDDEERRIVGTIYVQTGAFEARRIGGAMVAANMAPNICATRWPTGPRTGSRWSTAGAAACAAARWSPGCAWSAGTRSSSRAATRAFAGT